MSIASRLGVRAHARGRAFAAGEEASPEAHRSRHLDAVAAFRRVWDRNRDPGEPEDRRHRARGAARPPGPTHVATGRASATPQPGGGGVLGPTKPVPDPAAAPAAGDPVQCHILRRRGKPGRARPRRQAVPRILSVPGRAGHDAWLAHGRRDVLLSARRQEEVYLLELRHLAGRGGPEPTRRRVFGKLRSNRTRHGVHRVRQSAKPGAIELSVDPRARRVPRTSRRAGSGGPRGRSRPELNSARFGTTTTCWARRARGS